MSHSDSYFAAQHLTSTPLLPYLWQLKGDSAKAGFRPNRPPSTHWKLHPRGLTAHPTRRSNANSNSIRSDHVYPAARPYPRSSRRRDRDRARRHHHPRYRQGKPQQAKSSRSARASPTTKAGIPSDVKPATGSSSASAAAPRSSSTAKTSSSCTKTKSSASSSPSNYRPHTFGCPT